MTQENRRQIVFDALTQYGVYRDALYFTEAEYAALTQQDIDALIQGRVSAYIANIQNPAPPPTPQFTVTNQDGTTTDA